MLPGFLHILENSFRYYVPNYMLDRLYLLVENMGYMVPREGFFFVFFLKITALLRRKFSMSENLLVLSCRKEIDFRFIIDSLSSYNLKGIERLCKVKPL